MVIIEEAMPRSLSVFLKDFRTSKALVTGSVSSRIRVSAGSVSVSFSDGTQAVYIRLCVKSTRTQEYFPGISVKYRVEKPGIILYNCE